MNREKLLFILRGVGCQLSVHIDNVLNDSIEDPHHSAVYTCNLIKSYIELMTQLGEELPYHDIKSCFLFEGFSIKEYEAFENSRKKESEYYRGEQF